MLKEKRNGTDIWTRVKPFIELSRDIMSISALEILYSLVV